MSNQIIESATNSFIMYDDNSLGLGESGGATIISMYGAGFYIVLVFFVGGLTGFILGLVIFRLREVDEGNN
jgi:hypothetical protein